MTSNPKSRDPEGRAVNDKGVAFADVLAAARRGEELDPIDVLRAQSWRIDNQAREIASLRKQLSAARSRVETTVHIESDCSTGIGGVTLVQMAENIKLGLNPYTGSETTGELERLRMLQEKALALDDAVAEFGIDKPQYIAEVYQAFHDMLHDGHGAMHAVEPSAPLVAHSKSQQRRFEAQGREAIAAATKGQALPVRQLGPNAAPELGAEASGDRQASPLKATETPEHRRAAIEAAALADAHRMYEATHGKPFAHTAHLATCQGGSGGRCCDPDCETCWSENGSAVNNNGESK